MVAEFYLIPESFIFNPNLSRQEIEARIRNLANDMVWIKKYKDTNRFFVHPEIYSVNFLNGITLTDLLSDSNFAKQQLNRDVFNSLLKIVVESSQTPISTKEVIEVLLKEHNKDICHGLVAFHPVDKVDPEFQIIYNLTGWLHFRRHFLGMYPKGSNFFVDECKKYFPDIVLHERNRNTIGAILGECPKKIIYHLAALNDRFRESQQPELNRTQVLEHFSIAASLDELASLEGNAERKDDLTFPFKNNVGTDQDVCCEPHLKLCYNDAYPGDSSYSNDRRIYFHEGMPSIEKGKILVGHIGNHL